MLLFIFHDFTGISLQVSNLNFLWLDYVIVYISNKYKI